MRDILDLLILKRGAIFLDCAAAVLDSMSDGFVAIDRDWLIIYVNTRGAEIQGHAPEFLLGRNCLRFTRMRLGPRSRVHTERR